MPEWTGRTVTHRDGIAAALAELTRHESSGTSSLARAVQTGEQAKLTPDASKLLPVVPELKGVLPWPGGLLKGATVAALGSASMVLTLLAGGMTDGAWATVVGQPWFGALAAHQDYGIPLDRLALVPDPGPDWPTVVSALIDGVGLVVVTAQAEDRTARTLQARARERGCVLIPTRPWPGADLVLARTAVRWTGLGQGRGRLRRQHATFRVTGRGRAAREKTLELMFPPASIAGPEPKPLYEPAADRKSEPRGRIPENRQPVSEESPLWANLAPNDPPVGLRNDLW